MAAAAISEVNFVDTSAVRVIATIAKVTQNDWVVLPFPGALAIGSEIITGGPETLSRPTLTVNNTGDAYDATSTTIAYDGATALTRPASAYLFKTSSGEIIFVTADSGYDGTSGNLTVGKRGALGTTASATGLADGNTLYLLGSFILGSATTGPVTLVYVPLPEDPDVNMA